MTRMTTMMCVLVLALFANVSRGDDVYTNGLGGGDWDAPTTWRGGKLPTPSDHVVIRRDDRVVFDLAEGEGPVCAKLTLDPQSVLLFKPKVSQPNVVFRLTEMIDCYGTIQADLTNKPDATVQIHFAGPIEDGRRMTIRKGGSLLLYGVADTPVNQRSISLTAEPADPDTPETENVIHADGGSMLDVRWVGLKDVALFAKEIDGTGYAVGQGINIEHNLFQGRSRLDITSCDTAKLNHNTIQGSNDVGGYAITVRSSPLVSVVGNHVAGGYLVGIYAYGSHDSRISDNTVRDIRQGMSFVHITGVLEHNKIYDASRAIDMNICTLTVEDNLFRNCGWPLRIIKSDVQLNNVKFEGTPEDKPLLTLDNSHLTLLNSPIEPERIAVGSPVEDAGRPMIVAFAYVVVKVKGKINPAMRLDARSTGLAPDKIDLNVRHSPTPLRADGLSALPGSRKALEVLTWTMAADGKITQGPAYDLSVLLPRNVGNAGYGTLLTQKITPDATWFRPDPDALTATLEVTLP